MTNDPNASTFSALVMSIASSAVISLGLAPDEGGNLQKDLSTARFNIDLLSMLKSKTKGNLAADEEQLLTQLIQDLQTKFVMGSKK